MRYELHVETTNPDFIARLGVAMEWGVENGLLDDWDGNHHALDMAAFEIDEVSGKSGDAQFVMCHDEEAEGR